MSDSVSDKLMKLFKPNEKLFLLSVSIGPVQEFIAEARKVKDLWTGSYLLSKATFQSMLPLINKYGTDAIIHPRVDVSPFYLSSIGQSISVDDLKFASLPNHYVAVVSSADIDTLVSELTKSVDDFWLPLANDVKTKLKLPDKALAEVWNFQVKDLFNIVWVATPTTIEQLGRDYKKAYRENQAFLADRKLTRTFAEWNGGPVEKCGQCGHREIIGDKNLWAQLPKHGGMIKKGEKLCAVCATKRFLNGNEIQEGASRKFNSTSDIASEPFRERFRKSINMVESCDFITALKQLLNTETLDIETIDGGLFYPEGLTVDAIEKEYGITPSEIESRTACEALAKLTKKICRPSEYYCIVGMDADKMGEWMSGYGIDDFVLTHQMELTSRLSVIGLRELPGHVKGWNGSLIYSGGDDLLAMGPLEGALPLIRALRASFNNGTQPFPTASAGIVIVHHQDSLRQAIEESRRAVELAKEGFDRDAVVILLRLSSGTTVDFGYKWILEDGQPLLPFLHELSTLMSGQSDDNISISFVHDLLQELPAFYFYADSTKWVFKCEMFKAETRRLLLRHIPKGESLREKIDYIIEMLAFLAAPGELWKQEKYDGQANLEAFLRIAAFIARKYKHMEV